MIFNISNSTRHTTRSKEARLQIASVVVDNLAMSCNRKKHNWVYFYHICIYRTSRDSGSPTHLEYFINTWKITLPMLAKIKICARANWTLHFGTCESTTKASILPITRTIILKTRINRHRKNLIQSFDSVTHTKKIKKEEGKKTVIPLSIQKVDILQISRNIARHWHSSFQTITFCIN